VYYKSEIFKLINSFIDVFEDNFALSTKFSSGTQDYIQDSGDGEDKSDDMINVKIEAPIVIFPEKTRMWIADLGTFEIVKDSNSHNKRKETVLEGKNTQLLFIEDHVDFFNLNGLETNDNLVAEYMSKMSNIISHLEFRVELFKTEESSVKIPTVNLVCKPLQVEFINRSLESLFSLILDIFKDTSREKEKIAKIKQRAEFSIKEEIEFDVGYENWASSFVYIENLTLYVVAANQQKILHYSMLSTLEDLKLESNEHHKRLTLSYRHRKFHFRENDKTKTGLTELQFKLGSLMSLLRSDLRPVTESELEPGKPSQVAKVNPSDNYIIGLLVESIDFNVSGYHKEGTNFFIKMEMASYGSKYWNGVEEGKFSLSNCSISDRKDSYKLMSVHEEAEAIAYRFTYQQGSLESEVTIKDIEWSYKEEYIRSLLYLVDFLLANMAKSLEMEPKPALEDSELNFETLLQSSTSSVKNTIKVNLLKSRVYLFYKTHMKNVELLSSNIRIVICMEGSEMSVDGDIGSVGLSDLHKYPFRGNSAFALKSPLIQMKKGGFVKFRVQMSGNDTRTEFQVNSFIVDWVQQRAMRFIDFIMYQVLEIFLPSLFSFSKYYSRENIIRYSLSILNWEKYAQNIITLENVEFNLCSTVSIDQKISLVIEKTEISNRRVLVPKVVNLSELSYFPFGNVESDIWSIALNKVCMRIIDDSITDQDGFGSLNQLSSEYFDLLVEVDFPVKLFELSFLYNIVEDLELFEPKYKKLFDEQFVSPKEQKAKEFIPIDEIKRQAKHFLQTTEKETIYVNGRYNIRISSSRLALDLTNLFINKIYAITSNNINFDDGKDEIFRNVYVSSTSGIQMYMTLSMGTLIAKVNDYKKEDTEVFRLALEKVNFVINKRSNFINLIDFEAADLTANFSEKLGMNPQYSQYLRYNRQDSSGKAMMGKMVFTPDYKKDIEMEFTRIRIVVFNFILRLFPELLSLDQLREHEGYEDPNVSKISILMKIKQSDLVLVSNEEYALVIYGDIDYHIRMDERVSQHLISLRNAEIFDCNENKYLANSSGRVVRRNICKKFDFNFLMKNEGVNTSYTISTSPILTKMTAYNIATLLTVARFQAEWEAKVAPYALSDVSKFPVVNYKTNMTFNLEHFSFVYVDNYADVFLPVLRFDVKVREFSMKSDQSTDLGVALEIKSDYNNSRTAKWEPFIEPFNVDLIYNKSPGMTLMTFFGGMEDSSEGLYLNFTEELTEVMLHCFSNANEVVATQKPVLLEKHIDTEDMTVYDSQFLIRNKTGYDILIQTVGDKKGKRTKIKNFTEMFVNFIIEDEFSTKDSINRDIILTFDEGVELSKWLVTVRSPDNLLDRQGKRVRDAGQRVFVGDHHQEGEAQARGRDLFARAPQEPHQYESAVRRAWRGWHVRHQGNQKRQRTIPNHL
jgi:hypothetical protein